ncbi:response regulator transcription factor [Bacillus sp. EAC]|uniref:response regulator transcription factor n=1 Tax=Bacillus sp. EAC TaxID=1978338 RepID=UPI000B453680|nr:response regulator transcription factor [Bacillus sp. EAC]
MNILLVEDDETLGPLIQYKLKKAFHEVDWVTNVDEANSYIALGNHDVYVFDWMLPDGTGIELCQLLRKQHDYTPILMLTARDAVSDRVAGLKYGADDYVIKPFSFEELIARIEALGRRKGTSWSNDSLKVGELILNMSAHTLSIRGEEIYLRRREFQLLAYLMRHAGQILTREQIISGVWGTAEVTPNTVDATIKLIRKKLDEVISEKYIHSYRGIGYSIRAKENEHRV